MGGSKQLKTKPTERSVAQFLEGLDPAKRADCETLISLMGAATGSPPKMWGASMVGFGSYRYRYESGREGEWFLAGFAPRKRELTVYIMPGFSGYEAQLAKLGRHKTGKSCLYLPSLATVDADVLASLVRESVEQMRGRYETST